MRSPECLIFGPNFLNLEVLSQRHLSLECGQFGEEIVVDAVAWTRRLHPSILAHGSARPPLQVKIGGLNNHSKPGGILDLSEEFENPQPRIHRILDC